MYQRPILEWASIVKQGRPGSEVRPPSLALLPTASPPVPSRVDESGNVPGRTKNAAPFARCGSSSRGTRSRNASWFFPAPPCYVPVPLLLPYDHGDWLNTSVTGLTRRSTSSVRLREAHHAEMGPARVVRGRGACATGAQRAWATCVAPRLPRQLQPQPAGGWACHVPAPLCSLCGAGETCASGLYRGCGKMCVRFVPGHEGDSASCFEDY